MRAQEFITELKIDNDKGLGAVPKNKDIDYFGLEVQMRPSTFLKLALPLTLTDKDQQIIKDITQKKDEPGFGAPFLDIDIPDEWEQGDTSKPAKIVGHDGRHRMLSILQSEGDNPVEVHIFPLGLRRRHFDANPDWAKQLNQIIIGQRGNSVSGPIFQESGMNEALVSYLTTIEDFSKPARVEMRTKEIKRKAAAYLGKNQEEMNETDYKQVRAKANKIKKSNNKAERRKGEKISRQASWYDSFHK